MEEQQSIQQENNALLPEKNNNICNSQDSSNYTTTSCGASSISQPQRAQVSIYNIVFICIANANYTIEAKRQAICSTRNTKE